MNVLRRVDSLIRLVPALVGILPIGQRLGEETSRKQVLHVPLWCRLGMPSPEDPSSSPLISIKLRLNEVSEVELVIIAQVRDSTSILPVTATNDVAVWESAVITSAFAKAVKPLRAVCLCTSPFANLGPLVGAGEPGTDSTSGSDMLCGTPTDFSRAEDLVLVGAKQVVIGSCREAIPVSVKILEGIHKTDNRVSAVGTDCVVTFVVKVLDCIKVQHRSEWLIQELNDGDCVAVVSVALRDALDCIDCLSDCVAL